MKNIILILVFSSSLLLTACGGGGGSSGSVGGGEGGPETTVGDTSGLGNTKPSNSAEAARFLHQATFGANETEIDNLKSKTYNQWITEQIQKPYASAKNYYLQYWEAADAVNDRGNLNNQFFWQRVAKGEDQLRQRVAYALSQIFVVGFDFTRFVMEGNASYADMLAKNAFGNFRDLLEDVTLHPRMGLYLATLRNQKEDPNTGRVPDQNYAREVMQLFTIGLNELNLDGTVKDFNGNPKETYTSDDIVGLSRVFTGWGVACKPGSRKDYCFLYEANREDRYASLPMQPYSDYHSTSEKKFLGQTIAAGSSDPVADLDKALDTLFNHPNVGPFISKQLIQRLVTSNPKPEYVKRVASVFNNNGNGVRGDMTAVIRAILTDTEARNIPTGDDVNQQGKVREPVIRFANWLRAFNVQSAAPPSNKPWAYYNFGFTNEPSLTLGQQAYSAPSVFNFYRPGYKAPRSFSAAANLVAPELQITDEVSVAGYANFLYGKLNGATNAGANLATSYAPEFNLATNPQALVDRLNILLAGGQLRQSTVDTIVTAITSINIPATNQTNIDAAKYNRVKAAIYLVMTSTDYLVQK